MVRLHLFIQKWQREVGAEGERGGRSRTRADPDQMEVRGGHGWRDGGRDEGTGLSWRSL